MKVSDQFKIASKLFKDSDVNHESQKEALATAEFLLSMCDSVDFLIFSGPTGVGKSHLLSKLVANVDNTYADQCNVMPSMVPCILTMAAADGAKKFTWARFWREALEALSDPFCNSRSRPVIGKQKVQQLYPGEGPSTAQLRDQVEKELMLRSTVVWVVDEAQHMLLGGTAGEPGDQFDVLKSVAQRTGVKIVLCGTYQLPSLLSYSGQVMRRSATVSLKPYSFKSKTELRHFISVAKALLHVLPIRSYPEPSENAETLYFGTLGCVGVLKDWIARAWAFAEFKKSDVLNMEHFEQTRISPLALREMNIEIQAGESLSAPAIEEAYRVEVVSGVKEKATQKIGRKRRPGERRPGRDRVAQRIGAAR